MKKSINIQKKLRSQKFQFHQYWNFRYTERDQYGCEKDYFSIIKAKSYDSAKLILTQKINEDNPSLKAKSIQGAMFHKDYSHNGTTLTPELWSNIRGASFPNIANILYKKLMPRAEGKWNRFSYPRDLSKIGFKKGDENWSKLHRKGKTLAPELRKGKVWKGDKWVKWDEENMIKTKNLIINALIVNNNNRSKSAEYLNLDRNYLYKIMSRIPGIDWKKEYPPPKPFINAKPARRGLRSKIQKRVMLEKMSKGEKPFTLTDKQESKRIKNVVAFKSNQRKASISKNIPLIKEALEKNGNIRKEAATYLNVKYSWLHKWMSQTKHIVDWSKEYPSPHTNIKK